MTGLDRVIACHCEWRLWRRRRHRGAQAISLVLRTVVFHSPNRFRHFERWYFPVDVTGTSPPKTTTFGDFVYGRCLLHALSTCSSVSMTPGFGFTYAPTSSPYQSFSKSHGDPHFDPREVHEDLVDLEGGDVHAPP